jgi:anti-sigma regulatory factor (Ser/Thr protein kinase)
MTPDPRRQSPAPDVQPGSLVLDQPFDTGSLYALRAAVAAHAVQAGMSEFRAGDIVLAVHELAVNAIRHGAGHGRLVIENRDGALHCQVTDDGAPPAASDGAAPEKRPVLVGDAPWPSQHGHGLWLVRQVADQASVRSGPDGTVATASFTLPVPG